MSQKSYDGSPTLYLIPTPIGNMEDITLRAIKTLNEIEVLFCEDTRETGKLLTHLNIKKKMISNHEHNERKNEDVLLSYLNKGLNVGLASDRGTPIISDPGYGLVQVAIKNNYNVVALPGATAFVPALITSGLPPTPFLFYGFLNSKETKRTAELEELKNRKETLIFYESPHRISETIQSISTVFGKNREISISREISKKHEEVFREKIEDLEKPLNIKGEVVLVVLGNNEEENYDKISTKDHIELYIKDGFTKMDAIKQVAKERKLKKSDLYSEHMKNEVDKK